MRTVGVLTVAASLLLAVPVHAQAGNSSPVLIVQDVTMRFHLEPPSLEIPVGNSSLATLEADVHLELLNPVGKSVAAGDAVVRADPGSHVVSVPWSGLNLPSHSPPDLHWYRLPHRLSPRARRR